MCSKGNGGSQSSFSYAHLAFFLLLPKILVGIMLPRNAASKIHGITLASKQSKGALLRQAVFHCDTEKSCRYDCRTECRVKSAEHCNTVADAHSAEDDREEVTAFPTRLYADVCENKFKHTADNKNPRCKFGKAFLDNGNTFFARKHCEGRYVPITPRIIPPRVVLIIMPSLP